MRCTTRQVLGIAAAAVLCGTANAARVGIDAWAPSSTPGGSGGTASVDPLHLPVGGPLSGVTSLSFSSGIGGPYQVGTLGGLSEYVFGDPSTSTLLAPSEQVILNPGGNEVKIRFGYDYHVDDSTGLPTNAAGDFGGAGEVAKLTINGVTYTTKPGIAPNSLGGPDFSGGLVTSSTFDDSAAVFDFLGGKLQDGLALAADWSSSDGSLEKLASMSAPEIDPASATSALTLLAGGLAIVLGGKRRELNRHRAK